MNAPIPLPQPALTLPARSRARLAALLLVAALGLAGGSAQVGDGAPTKGVPPAALTLAARPLPLSFTPNAGQSDPAVRFQVHSPQGTLLFTRAEVVLHLRGAGGAATRGGARSAGRVRAASASPAPLVLRLRFEGANRSPPIVGEEKLPGIVNYFLGADPAQWRTHLPTYAAIVYQALYPGIALRYDGTVGLLKGTYLLAPHADPARIRWRYAGADQVRLDNAGNLVLTLAPAHSADPAHPTSSIQHPTLMERAPVAWQQIKGQRVAVDVGYALAADGSMGFALGAYDPTYPLTIDPELAYGSYLGGGDLDTAY
ncbi:MAG: hypothetical protein ACRDIB_16905, partial [Ardenticatenaceae bacterium]